MDAGSSVCAIAVSKDGKWVVSGSDRLVTVWNVQNHSKVTEWKAHDRWVCRVDVSPDGTRIATVSDDGTLCVWSLSTAGERLLGALKHDHWVLVVKFSPNGRLIATAACDGNIRVYDSRTGGLVEFPSKVNSNSDHFLTWASDNDLLFVSSTVVSAKNVRDTKLVFENSKIWKIRKNRKCVSVVSYNPPPTPPKKTRNAP